MKIKPEDYEHIGDQFTRGLGIGCGASIVFVVAIGALIAFARWLP
ncbi:hypothetical protein [Sphingomonas sp.]